VRENGLLRVRPVGLNFFIVIYRCFIVAKRFDPLSLTSVFVNENKRRRIQ
jgi:hypothetical protein